MKRRVILTLALIAVLAMTVLVISGCCGLLRREPTPTPTAEAQATLPPTEESEVDDSWARVQAAGKLVVGTSADYPPFEYLTGDFQIDGFDVALMDEIGRRLGVRIEYRNFAFDGLGPALELGQIDTAIAAISVTPEREAAVDFSNVYFVGEDGVLVRGDSTITINSVDDLATYKVGVQRGSVYESWLQETLVDTGRMPDGNLHAYELAGDAVRDLKEGRVDIVVLDAHPAEVAVAAGGVRIAARGLNQQRMAIALPKGALALKGEIDIVLTELSNEGFIATLAKDYLNIDPETLLPTPTPSPEPATTPEPEATKPPTPPSCADGLAFVQHLNYDDKGMSAPPQFNPGQQFTKGWQVKNTGTCTWNTSYRLVYGHGNVPAARMGGQPLSISRDIAPGQTYDINLNLVAPLQPGTYQAFWQMENAKGLAFGERLPVGIRVVSHPTPTPVPTQTPAPGISFTVDRDQIQRGECVVFSWRVENVQAVYFYAEGERWQDNGVAGMSSQTECPPVTATYYLRVVLRDNSVEVQQITIYVEEAEEAPFIRRFTVDPPDQIALGQCVMLQWSVEGRVDQTTITADGTILWNDAPVKGQYQHCPDRTGTIGYGLEAKGPGGTSRALQNIKVAGAATPVPTAAPPDQPVIYSFSVTPNNIGAGGCVDVNWSAGGGATHAVIMRNGTVIGDQVDLTGHGTDCLDEPGGYAYRVEAYNNAGRSTSREQRVEVTSEGTENPLAGTRWRSTAIWNGSTLAPVLPGVDPPFTNFRPDGGIHGWDGCNEFSGEYNVVGNNVSISVEDGGRRVCPNAVTAQADAFKAALRSAASFSQEAYQLHILDGSGRVTIESVPR